MIRCENLAEGCGCTMYRTPTEIRRDIEAVNIRINEINSRLNVRNLLGELLEISVRASAESCISELEEVVAEAKELIDELGTLKDTLADLSCELEETKWEIGL